MNIISNKILIASTLFAIAATAQASAPHFITAPTCLLNASQIQADIISRNDNLVLAKVNDDAIEKLSDAKHQTKTPCGGFKDVTARWNRAHDKNGAKFLAGITTKPMSLQNAEMNYTIRYEKEANQIIHQLNPQRMWDSLSTFSSSKDRYADSKEGVAATEWIKSQVETAAQSAGRHDVTVTLVTTPGHKQPSVVVKLGNSTLPGIVIGAHLDTTSSRFERKPGADDDGSGSMTVMETARTIIGSSTTFKKPVYFIWYSAEELGLIGSQHVVEKFKEDNIPVDAVMHFDLTGYAYRNDPTIWLMKDNVDSKLTDFVEQIIKTYVKQPVKYTRCGYACSDHASWDEAGYPAVLPAEARFEDSNPAMHSSQDTIDKLSIMHMTDYAKIATAFAVELAEPASS